MTCCAQSACTHHGIPTAKPSTHSPRKKTLPQLPERKMRRMSIAVAKQPDAEELGECCQSDGHDQRQSGRRQGNRQLRGNHIHLHSLEESLEDIPFADKPGLGRQCGKTHRRKERADSEEEGRISQQPGLPDDIAAIDGIHAVGSEE